VYLIGLTGNIGSGKSTVGARLRELGAFVVDADLVYRQLIEPGQPGWRAVVDLFGPDVVDREGRIDRRALGAIVFPDPDALARLERATHPLVLARIDELLARARPRVAVHEAIKLIESGGADRCDELWVVTAPRERQIERLIASRGLTPEEAALRVDAQPPQSAKVARADVVIPNDADLASLKARVEQEWQRVQAVIPSAARDLDGRARHPKPRSGAGGRAGGDSSLRSG
jgi:dephospho-CoA kinase